MAKMVKAPVDHPYPSLYRDSHHPEFWFIIFLSVCILLLSMFKPKNYVVL